MIHVDVALMNLSRNKQKHWHFKLVLCRLLQHPNCVWEWSKQPSEHGNSDSPSLIFILESSVSFPLLAPSTTVAYSSYAEGSFTWRQWCFFFADNKFDCVSSDNTAHVQLMSLNNSNPVDISDFVEYQTEDRLNKRIKPKRLLKEFTLWLRRFGHQRLVISGEKPSSGWGWNSPPCSLI